MFAHAFICFVGIHEISHKESLSGLRSNTCFIVYPENPQTCLLMLQETQQAELPMATALTGATHICNTISSLKHILE